MKLFKNRYLLIAFIAISFNSLATVTICRINGGSSGYRLITEKHTPVSGGGSAHVLDCEEPGTTACVWTKLTPGPNELALPRINELVGFADLQIAQGNTNNNFLFPDAYMRISTTDIPGQIIIRIYTIPEATALGLL